MVKVIAVPETMLAKAPIINWHYISSEGNLDQVPASSGPPHVPTTTFSDCPTIDYLLIPGPDPTVKLSDECSSFINTRFPTLEGSLTICTGSLAIAQTGVLDGAQSATNKMALKFLAQAGLLNKKVKWVPDRRFVVDGKIWSAAGITSGVDLAAEFSRVHFDPEIVELVKAIMEYIPNPAQPDPFAYLLDGVGLD